MLKPIERYGLRTMSIGYIVAEDTPMIWRGPMVSSALEQMLRDVHGASSTCWWSTCRPAPAMPSSPSRSAWRSPAP